jgi:hypothetical protein
VNSYRMICSLRELRNVKYKLTSRGFSRYYEALRQGRFEESRVIRCGALKELDELFRLEQWLASLEGGVEILPPPSGGAPKSCHLGSAELCDRCRVLRLVNQRLSALNGSHVAARLRTFLAELAAEEAGRVNALFTECASS